MAAITGVLGGVTIPSGAGGVTANIFEWSANTPRDIHDATTFDSDTNARTKVGGMYDLKGTCQAYMDDGGLPILTHIQTANAPPVAAFVLTAHTGKTYTFPGIISDIGNVVQKAQGLSVVTLTFESSGDIVVA